MAELLSPAGSREALTAAVQSGADAVYMGFGDFNARRSARNFTDEDFASAVAYCHLRGVKVYLTLNTLVTDRELPAAAEALRKAAAMGADAVLIQDWGLFTLAREIVPDLPVHASTQMSLFTLGGANKAAELGMERVVLARELSREDIALICRECPAEIEVFVHGALCMCYSGQCELSAVLGGRSGNRGTCAQPCRLPYGVNGPCRDGHPLSLKDANLSPYLRELDEMGVACLKIEGRMKRPEYVAAVTGIYRRLLDEQRTPTAEERRQLSRAFDRSGFTDGYYLGKKGAQMLGMRPESARWPEEWFTVLRRDYENAEHRITPVSMALTVRTDTPASLTVTAGSRTVTVTGEVPQTALHRALTVDDLTARLRKTGGTVFTADEITVTLDDGLMLSAGAVNALRRDALSALEAELTAPPPRRNLPAAPLPPAPPPPAEPKFTVSLTYPAQLTPELACAAEIVYIPPEFPDTMDLTPYADKTTLCLVLPRVYRTADEAKLRALLQRHPEITHAAVSNLGHLPMVSDLGLTLHGDFGLNVYNSRSLLFLQEQGLQSAALSFELRHQQIRDMRKYLPCEAIVYGRLPLMITENCAAAVAAGCSHGAGCTLTDRTGAVFPVLCAYGCRSEMQNSTPLYLADKPEYRQIGLTYARLRFTTETAEACLDVLRRYQTGAKAPADFTRGLFYRGVD